MAIPRWPTPAFLLRYPDGFLADPALRLRGVRRDWYASLIAGDIVSLARRYCRLLAGHAGVEDAAVWEWGFLERVSTGLYLMSFGAEDAGTRFLAVAERLA